MEVHACVARRVFHAERRGANGGGSSISSSSSSSGFGDIAGRLRVCYAVSTPRLNRPNVLRDFALINAARSNQHYSRPAFHPARKPRAAGRGVCVPTVKVVVGLLGDVRAGMCAGATPNSHVPANTPRNFVTATATSRKTSCCSYSKPWRRRSRRHPRRRCGPLSCVIRDALFGSLLSDNLGVLLLVSVPVRPHPPPSSHSPSHAVN